ncbi:MAG: hypothetical protein ACRCY4_05935 [Brevinema sp.]
MRKKDAVLTVRIDTKIFDKIRDACNGQRISISEATRALFLAWISAKGKPQRLFPLKYRSLKKAYLDHLYKNPTDL